MKALFYLLCVLNLSMLLWALRDGRFEPVTVEQLPETSILTIEEFARAKRGAEIDKRIQTNLANWRQIEIEHMLADLRDEHWSLSPVQPKNPPKPQAVKAEAKKPVLPVIVNKCFETGPFDDEASLKKWLDQKALVSKQIVQRELITNTDFQVYFAAAKTPEQARLNKSMLNAKGIQDIWTIPDGDNKGGFSLGVFVDKQRALLFKSQLEGQGIHAEIKQRQKTKVQWFVKVMLDKTQVGKYESTTLKFSACPGH